MYWGLFFKSKHEADCRRPISNLNNNKMFVYNWWYGDTIRRLRYETRSCCSLSQCGHAHMAAFIFCTQRKPNCMNVYKWPLDQQIGTRRMQLVASFKAAPRLSRRTATLSNWPEVMATSSRLSIASQCPFFLSGWASLPAVFALTKSTSHYIQSRCWRS